MSHAFEVRFAASEQIHDGQSDRLALAHREQFAPIGTRDELMAIANRSAQPLQVRSGR
jgi:hypothetical protein